MHFTLADYVLDIVQNAVEAGSREVKLNLDESDYGIRVEVVDDGKGMSEEELKRALDPFYTDGLKHAKRRVGLGLPFLEQATAQSGGEFAIESKKGRGSRVSFGFPAANVDSPPMGELPALFLSALALSGDHEMLVRRTRRAGSRGAVALDYEFRRSELLEALGGLELASSLALLREFLASQEDDGDAESSVGTCDATSQEDDGDAESSVGTCDAMSQEDDGDAESPVGTCDATSQEDENEVNASGKSA